MESKIEQLIANLVWRTAKLLQSAQNELSEVNWQDGESNTDSGYSMVARRKFAEAFDELVKDQTNIKLVSNKAPDITYRMLINGEELVGKIELKSCKSDSKDVGVIPGSTIRDLDWNVWVIFCRRSSDNKNFEFRYGRYFLGIDIKPTELFQDRSPRPRISWNKYQLLDEEPKLGKLNQDDDWIKKYAQAAVNRISGEYNVDSSWQDTLVREIIKIARERQITGE